MKFRLNKINKMNAYYFAINLKGFIFDICIWFKFKFEFWSYQFYWLICFYNLF